MTQPTDSKQLLTEALALLPDVDDGCQPWNFAKQADRDSLATFLLVASPRLAAVMEKGLVEPTTDFQRQVVQRNIDLTNEILALRQADTLDAAWAAAAREALLRIRHLAAQRAHLDPTLDDILQEATRALTAQLTKGTDK